MRALVAHGVFEEETGDHFRLNAAGELMRRDVPGSQRAAVLFTAGDTQWRLWSDFLECVRTGRAVVERLFGQTIFERNAQNPEEAELFSQAMASFSAALSPPLMAAYDFGSIQRIADIGGGTGRLLADLLAAHRNARGVLFDLPNVVTGASAILAASGRVARLLAAVFLTASRVALTPMCCGRSCTIGTTIAPSPSSPIAERL